MMEARKVAETGYTLITGASGFIGNALAHQLAGERPVICLSRRKLKSDLAFVRGEFHSFEDLRQLDKFAITGVVHLAAVTGGCSEEDGLEINVSGTRRLLRYALDRGCRKFVLASSIAAVGCLTEGFLPLQLPMPDEHPCLAQDAYGLSKAMMEDLTRYFNRVFPDSDFINLRLGGVDNPASPPTVYSVNNPPNLPFVNLGHVSLGGVLQAFDLAIKAPAQPGVRVFNVVGRDMNTSDPVPQVLRASLGARSAQLDLSWYASPDHAYSPLYTMDKIEKNLGLSLEKSARLSYRMFRGPAG
jgi:nucleoside-diphosphate-sugar epimerase